jgi:putative ABC transport system permease protein
MSVQRLRSILARVREAFSRRRIADELDEELRLHLELELEYNIARGMSPADARRAATLAFGGVERFREETRESRGFVAVERVMRDLRFTLRRFRRAPAFTVGAIATLAIGLGAATGIGALVYGVMLRPLPYPDPDHLVRVSVLTPGLGSTTTGHSPGTLAYFAERARSFTELGGYYENTVCRSPTATSRSRPPPRC